MDSLVSTDWLQRELGSPGIRLIDATWFLPGSGRDARAEYAQAHIDGAVFLDLETVADPDNLLPHMVPPDHVFASRMQALGIGDGHRIIVYDNSPLHTSARIWWMLRAFGARQVAILDGGLQKWKAEGRPLTASKTEALQGHFTAAFDPSTTMSKMQVADLAGRTDHVIVDARSPDRFAGEEAEPRPGSEPGHIPGSLNLPQGALFNSDNEWKRGEELRSAFEASGVDLDRPMVTSCGSGITACVLLFGAHLLGKTDARLYDGSWAQWGSDPALPKAKGAA